MRRAGRSSLAARARARRSAAAAAATVTTATAGSPAGSIGDATVRRPSSARRPSRSSAAPAATATSIPAAIYDRDAPGVVTVFSVAARRVRRRAATARQGLGSGFVAQRRGEIATNAHVVTEGEGRAIRKAKEVYVAFADGNQVPAKIVGFDPNADVALLKIDPAGLTLRPLRARHRARPARRLAGGGDRLAVRRAAVAVGRRRVGDRPLDHVADGL